MKRFSLLSSMFVKGFSLLLSYSVSEEILLPSYLLFFLHSFSVNKEILLLLFLLFLLMKRSPCLSSSFIFTVLICILSLSLSLLPRLCLNRWLLCSVHTVLFGESSATVGRTERSTSAGLLYIRTDAGQAGGSNWTPCLGWT